MQKIIIVFFFLSLSTFAHSQNDLLIAKNRAELQKKLDSAMVSSYFITVAEAEKILEKPAHLKDSTYKLSNGILRYAFDYVVTYVDSTSKGKLFFSYEQYKDLEIAKSTYATIKTENEKSNNLTALSDVGDEAFLQKDYLNQPFLMIRKGNIIYKIKVYSVTDKTSLAELLILSKKIVASH